MKVLKILGAVLLILAIAFFTAGLIKPDLHYVTQVQLDIPAHKAFEKYNDLTKAKEWMPGFVRYEIVTINPNMVGTEIAFTFNEGGQEIKVTETLLEYEFNQKVTLGFDIDMMQKIDTVYFVPIDNQKSAIRHCTYLKGNSYTYQCLFAFMQGAFSAVDQELLDRFKSFAEG